MPAVLFEKSFSMKFGQSRIKAMRALHLENVVYIFESENNSFN